MTHFLWEKEVPEPKMSAVPGLTQFTCTDEAALYCDDQFIPWTVGLWILFSTDWVICTSDFSGIPSHISPYATRFACTGENDAYRSFLTQQPCRYWSRPCLVAPEHFHIWAAIRPQHGISAWSSRLRLLFPVADTLSAASQHRAYFVESCQTVYQLGQED